MDQAEINAAAAGAPALVKIGAQSYMASPLNDQDYGLLVQWIKKRFRSPVAIIQDELAGMTPALQEKALRIALEMKQTGGATPTGESFREHLMSPEGCALLAWLMIRKQHPAVPIEVLQSEITDSNVVQILAELFEASGVANLGKARIGGNGSPPGAVATSPALTGS